MRAILIDPEHQTITDTEIVGKDYRELLPIIGCKRFTIGSRPLRGNMSTRVR
jgi:hypothetical protein